MMSFKDDPFKNQARQEPSFCLKNNKKDTIFPKKKSKNILYLAGQGGGKSPHCPPPADAHVSDFTGPFIFVRFNRRA
jgi:hypothetical protein